MARPHRILVVDDHLDAAQATSLLLSMLGHACRPVFTGTEALAQVATFEPDIVILDIGLPDLSGYEVAREIRRRHSERAIHLAALTGWGLTEDRVRALAAGFDQHVLKPVDAAKLRALIEVAERHLPAPTSP